jgi:uncharacterized membrane protein
LVPLVRKGFESRSARAERGCPQKRTEARRVAEIFLRRQENHPWPNPLDLYQLIHFLWHNNFMVNERQWTYAAFLLGVWAKLGTGLLEIAASILLFLTGGISHLFLTLARHELGEDPGDFVANKTIEYLPYLSTSMQTFAAWYFLLHGVVHILVAAALLARRLWAFPLALTVHVGFVFYELYRYTHTHSFLLILLILFDIFVTFFIWREYTILREKNETA